jgi:hypothetical protein
VTAAREANPVEREAAHSSRPPQAGISAILENIFRFQEL